MMHRKVVLRVVSKFLIPPILLFALYVQFQAGVIFGAAFILYAILFGVETAKKVLPPWVTRLLLVVGVLTYGLCGVAGLLLGGNYLDYNVLAHDPLHGQHYGILIVEAGVGITVAAAMITIFNVFAGQTGED